MSTGAVATNSINQELQQYFQTRTTDQEALGKALQSGDLASAQQEYAAIQTLAQSGPFANGNAYIAPQREQDFAAVGQALQAGDLAGAQQAFAQFKSTFQKQGSNVQQQADQNPAVVVNIGLGNGTSGSGSGSSAGATTGSAATGNGSEIILNLGNATPGEQITIGVSNGANGQEQLTIGVANQAGQTPEQFTLNLAQTANQEIILNLFNSTASSASASSGVNVSA